MNNTNDCQSKSEEQHVFLPGQVIFREGDNGDTMYIIADGEVNISVNDCVLEVLKAGDIFGEMTLIEERPRTATATARSACSLTPVTREHFLQLVRRTPAFAIQVMRVLTARLRRTTRQIHTK